MDIQAQKKYDRWHQDLAIQRGVDRISLSEWHRDALELLGGIRGKNALEVGCGNGDFALHLAGLGCNLTAVDFSPAAVEAAKERQRAFFAGAGEVEFRTADAERLDFPDSTFEIVVSCECLEHLPHPKEALKEFFRVLVPGGKLVLTTENYSNGMILAWLMCWIRSHPFNSGAGVQPIEQFFLYWRVRRMMERVGFKVKHMMGHHHVFLLLPRLHPHTLVVERFANPVLKKILFPFARHIAFEAVKP